MNDTLAPLVPVMFMGTIAAFPLIKFVIFMTALAIGMNLLLFKNLPFRFSLRATKYKRSFYNASDIVFKLVQWSLFVAGVTVAANKTGSINLAIIGIVLQFFLIGSVYNVFWSIIEARITFSERESMLSIRQWKILFFALVAYPILDVQRFVTQLAAEFTRNLSLH